MTSAAIRRRTADIGHYGVAITRTTQWDVTSLKDVLALGLP
jgi:hypothetical protein